MGKISEPTEVAKTNHFRQLHEAATIISFIMSRTSSVAPGYLWGLENRLVTKLKGLMFVPGGPWHSVSLATT